MEVSLLSMTMLFTASRRPTRDPRLLIRRFGILIHPKPLLKTIISQSFTEAMNTLSANMRRLVLEVSISDLSKLEEHRKSIHELVSREHTSISVARGELLAQL